MARGSNAARDGKFCGPRIDFVAHKLDAKPANCILIKPISKKDPAALHLENFAQKLALKVLIFKKEKSFRLLLG